MSIELYRNLGIEDPAHLGFDRRVTLCCIRRREAADHPGICIVMEDRGAAIPAGEDMIEPAGDNEAWLTGDWGRTYNEGMNKSIRMPDPNSTTRPRERHIS